MEYLRGRPEFTNAKNHSRILTTCLSTIALAKSDLRGFARRPSQIVAQSNQDDLTKVPREPSVYDPLRLAPFLGPAGYFSFWGYSTVMWMVHYKRVLTLGDSEARRSALDFLQYINLKGWDASIRYLLDGLKKIDRSYYGFQNRVFFRGILGESADDEYPFPIYLEECLCDEEDQIFLACVFGFTALLERYFQTDCVYIGRRNKGGRSLLHAACHFGFPDIVSFLLTHGADLMMLAPLTINVDYDLVWTNFRTSNRLFDPPPPIVKISPLHEAIIYKRTEICRLLLKDPRLDIALLPDSMGNTPLHLAYVLDDLAREIMMASPKASLQKSLESRNRAGMTLLHWAVSNSKSESDIMDLVKLGADVNSRIQECIETECSKQVSSFNRTLVGYSPLHLMLNGKEYRTQYSDYERASVIRVLLEHGVDVHGNFGNSNEGTYTPLHYACRLRAGPKMIDHLLEFQARHDLEIGGNYRIELDHLPMGPCV